MYQTSSIQILLLCKYITSKLNLIIIDSKILKNTHHIPEHQNFAIDEMGIDFTSIGGD
jgi:hypothetical protein